MSYKMNHSKSAFPFKSPVKQNRRAIQEGVPGHEPMSRPNQAQFGPNAPDQDRLYSPSGAADFYREYQERQAGRRKVGESPTPTPEEYEAQGLNRYGGTDMSI